MARHLAALANTTGAPAHKAEELQPAHSGNSDAARHLTIAFPIGVFPGDPRIIQCGLDVSRCIDRPGGNRVLTRLHIGPIKMPNLPGKFRFLAVIDTGLYPGTIVDLYLDLGYRRSPSRPGDAVGVINLCYSCWRRFQQRTADRGLGPDGLAIVIFLADGYIVAPPSAGS